MVVFRTSSDIEAHVVQALLESQGIESVRTGGSPPGVFAFAVSPLGETLVSVREEDAEEATRVISSHRERIGTATVVPLRHEFVNLETRVGYRFRDRGLLEHALTHRSKAHEDPSGGVIDNESLEFLGDAVLGMVVAEALFRAFPDYSEGQKSKIKSALVSTAALGELAVRLGLGEHMILGRGEEKTGGRAKQALLADTCEALIAAVYLDGGLDAVRQFILREIGPAIEEARRPDYFGRDYKSVLQEQLQGLGRPLPIYRVAGEIGPDHRKMFRVEVVVGTDVVAEGSGRTKKEAEQDAAKTALATLARDSVGSREWGVGSRDSGMEGTE